MSKVPKGTRDLNPSQVEVRERAITLIKEIFRRHGAVGIDTPVFELKETLIGEYGEDQKLIYDLKDQGGEICSLRYDLTVPFARWLSSNNYGNIKRYHIAKVYRRDNPSISQGRYREFYQCDYDIAGTYDIMIPEADVLRVLYEVLTELQIGEFRILINHRLLLNSILTITGVPSGLIRTICSSIDKLDKESWDTVKDEMLNKGLKENVIEALHQFMKIKGRPEKVIHQLLEIINNYPKKDIKDGIKYAKQALDELSLLVKYLDEMGVSDCCELHVCLARGLDYYTGLIFEASIMNDKDNSPEDGDGKGVGSIAGGGRYDNLIKKFGPRSIPAIGVSIGIERIFSWLERKNSSQTMHTCPTQVLVASIGKNMLLERMKLSCELWNNGIRAEFLFENECKPKKQTTYAAVNDIPLVAFIGEDEIRTQQIALKSMKKRKQESIPRSQICSVIQEWLNEGTEKTLKKQENYTKDKTYDLSVLESRAKSAEKILEKLSQVLDRVETKNTNKLEQKPICQIDLKAIIQKESSPIDSLKRINLHPFLKSIQQQ